MTRRMTAIASSTGLAAGWLVTVVWTQAAAGVVAGRVTDPSGAVLPGVTITLIGGALDRPRTATTSIDGSFRFTAVPDGTFTLKAELSGFARYTQTVTVERGGQVNLPAIKMEIGPMSEPNLERMGLTPSDIPIEFTTSLGRFGLAVRRGPAPALADAFLKHLDAHFYDGGLIAPVVAHEGSMAVASIEALALVERADVSDASARAVILPNDQVAAGPSRDVIGRVWHWPDGFTADRVNLIARIFQEGPSAPAAQSRIAITRAGRVILLTPAGHSAKSTHAWIE